MKYLRLLVLSLIGIMVVLANNGGQASAQSGIVWNTQFFNNPYLLGPAVVSRQDSGIGFNWGTGSPATGVNADNFTARFSTNAFFEGQTYRFSIIADDGVKLLLDDYTVVINTFDNPRPSQTLTADVQMSAGRHNVQLDFREVQGDAFVYLNWEPVTANNPVVVAPPPSAPVTSGWTAEYYSNANLTGNPTAILNVLSPSNNWGFGSPLSVIPADNFSARFTGNLVLEGTYDIILRADDGVRVFVNGVSYINQWRGATGQTYTARFNVPRGTHRIVIEYYEASGSAFLQYGLNRTDVTSTATVIQPSNQVGNVGWTAQYFNNPSLTGSPVLVQTEYGISRTWGNGAPAANIPADNFSVRWSSVQPLTAGTYQLSVRADDGVRVYINGVSYINEWHPSNATTNYVATVTLPTGNHSILVEYYDGGDRAMIEYSLTRSDTIVNNPPQTNTNPGNARMTVTSALLNVRQSPAITGRVLTQISRNQSYGIVGRNVDSTWWQINVNGTVGWVNAFFTSASNIQNVPVTSTTTQVNPPTTGFAVTTTAAVNLRTGAGTTFSILNVIPRNTSVSILARNADTTWWQVNYRGVVGWVNAGFVTLQSNAQLSQIPISR